MANSQTYKLSPWHLYSLVFLGFWILSAYFDSFFITALLCLGGGLVSDSLQRFMTGNVKKVDLAPTKPLPPEPPAEEEAPAPLGQPAKPQPEVTSSQDVLSNKPGSLLDFGRPDDPDSDLEKEMDIKTKTYADLDEGDPWKSEQFEEYPARDDASHRAVFGDEEDANVAALDDSSTNGKDDLFDPFSGSSGNAETEKSHTDDLLGL